MLLYELFTGRLPFKGVHETALAYEIVNVDPEPMSAVNPALDPELDAIVLECLQKDPEERYQSVKEIARDLKRVRRESSRARMSRTFSAQPGPRQSGSSAGTSSASMPAGGAAQASSGYDAVAPAPKKSSTGWIVWLAVLLVAGLGVVGTFWRPWAAPERPAGPVTRLTIRFPEEVLIPIGSSGIGISPDGKFLSLAVQSGLETQLFIRPSDREALEPVPGSRIPAGQVYYHAFSPDGEWLAFTPGNTIRKASVFGGAAVNICDVDGQPRGLWWGTDGNIYFGHISSVIRKVSAAGGPAEPVTTLDTSAGELSHRFPALLPDGKSVLYTIKFNNITSFEEAAIAVIRHEERREENPHPRRIVRPVRSDRTYRLRERQLSLCRSVRPGKTRGDRAPEKTLQGRMDEPVLGRRQHHLHRQRHPSLRSAGKRIVQRQPHQMDRFQGQHHPPRRHDEFILDRPTFTRRRKIGPARAGRQRRHLGVPSREEEPHPTDLRRRQQRIPGLDRGREIRHLRGGTQNEKRYLPQGVGRLGRRRATDQLREDGLPAFVEPRRRRPWHSRRTADIWLLGMGEGGTSSAFLETKATEFNPVFSPDGRYLAYESNESGRYEVYITSYPSKSGKWQISSGGGSNPIWDPSGKVLYFTQGTSINAVDLRPGAGFDFSAPRKVLDLPPDGSAITGISPDGKRFAMITVPYDELNTSEVTLVTGWFQELRKRVRGQMRRIA